MQALHPMHLPAVTSTTAPGFATWLAPVGQQETHGGRSQWLHRSLLISRRGDGNSPRVSYVIQSRQKPSGTSFSVLHATTQSMHPTHLRVSMAIPYREPLGCSPAIGLRLRLDRYEVHVHAGAAHQRVDLVARDELRIARALAERTLQRPRRVPEAVHHKNAVGPDPFGGPDAPALADHAVLVRQPHVVAGGEAQPRRHLRVHPHVVLGHH